MKKFIILFQAAFLFFAACAEKEETVKEATKEASEFMLTELVAEVPEINFGDESKTSVSTNGQFSWSADDQLGFIPDQGAVRFDTPQPFIFYVTSGGSNKATFKANGWGLIRKKRYYSYYPYSDNNTYNKVSISYPETTQTANDNTGHLGKNDYLHSYVDISESGNIDLTYKHIGSMAKFVLTLPSAFSTSEFNKLVLSTTQSVFLSSATYNPSATSVTLADRTNASSITINLSNFKSSSNKITVYAMVGPADWSGKTITATLTDKAGHTFTGTFAGANQVAGKGHQYTSKLQQVATDLSSGEKANCYIVPSSGYYKFYAANQGNSSTSIGTVSSVVVLWETDNTAGTQSIGSIISDVRYNTEDNYISFYRGSKKGNALIAAKDASGNILWSWHIWCTDTPKDEVYANSAGSLMDRNLGAIATTGYLSCGLMYQWGRKDPFPGAANITFTQLGEGQSTRMKTTATFGKVEINSTNGNVDWATKNPTTFIHSKAVSSSTKLDWLNNQDGTLWGGTTKTKTKYDPCPPGYRVPDGSSSATDLANGFWAKALQVKGVLAGSSKNNYQFPVTINSSNKLITFAHVTGQDGVLTVPLNSGTTTYPAAGGYSDGPSAIDSGDDFAWAGNHVLLWTNYPAGTSGGTTWNTPYSGSFNLNVSGSDVTTHQFSVSWNSGRAAGKSIRCMSMKK